MDDNFRMDESKRALHGVFATPAEAIAACRKIVDELLANCFEPGMSSAALYERYTQFGDDPWIAAVDSKASPPVDFSAWDYARRRCEQIVRSNETDLEERQA